jgi:hypothetical protein
MGETNDTESPSPRKEKVLSNMVAINQREVLMALYEYLDGKKWLRSDNWGTDAPISEWYGVKEVDKDGNITKLYLDENNLTGVIED